MGATANHTPNAKKPSVRRLWSKLTSPSKKKIEKRAAKAHRKSLSTVLSTLPNNVENKEKHAETLKTVLSELFLNTAGTQEKHRRELKSSPFTSARTSAQDFTKWEAEQRKLVAQSRERGEKLTQVVAELREVKAKLATSNERIQTIESRQSLARKDFDKVLEGHRERGEKLTQVVAELREVKAKLATLNERIQTLESGQSLARKGLDKVLEGHARPVYDPHEFDNDLLLDMISAAAQGLGTVGGIIGTAAGIIGTVVHGLGSVAVNLINVTAGNVEKKPLSPKERARERG
jgi:chromosome segregation ATPase